MSPSADRRSAHAGILVRHIDIALDLADLHAANPERYPHLLQSVAHETPRGRFDILFAFPGPSLVLKSDGDLFVDGQALPQSNFLDTLDAVWRTHALAAATPSIPFHGGWFVYLSYELAAQVEPRLGTLPTETDFPIAIATRVPAAIIRDHEAQETYAMCEFEHPQLLDQMIDDVARVSKAEAEPISVFTPQEDDAAVFLQGVERVLEYIRAGDVFQVNLSRRWRAALKQPVRPVTLYQRLRATNPSPFAGLATFGSRQAIISSSPERLVEVRGRTVRTRPIAGTYPRSADPREDAQRSQELLMHPKERAEHVMLIDLERNDLGRVCRPGTVKVNELMSLESYRHVHHIVSEVSGELLPSAGPAQVLRAVFPGGTITGCPKVRCMEIIAELERAPRGAYTGSMGYINRDGSMDFNILIRTLVQSGNSLRWRAGAGIVADSQPERELQETRAKARGVAAALEQGA